ncbi:unnamed protein product [Orchesella dallaii]|uniref:Uncharacterized protein n=1 Tax=Orchesella dallaii TaxID=48710 RepID=A0ABP1R1U8_9HEXA
MERFSRVMVVPLALVVSTSAVPELQNGEDMGRVGQEVQIVLNVKVRDGRMSLSQDEKIFYFSIQGSQRSIFTSSEPTRAVKLILQPRRVKDHETKIIKVLNANFGNEVEDSIIYWNLKNLENTSVRDANGTMGMFRDPRPNVVTIVISTEFYTNRMKGSTGKTLDSKGPKIGSKLEILQTILPTIKCGRYKCILVDINENSCSFRKHNVQLTLMYTGKIIKATKQD